MRRFSKRILRDLMIVEISSLILMMIYLKAANFRGILISFLLSFGILNLTYTSARFLERFVPGSKIMNFLMYSLGLVISFEIVLPFLRYVSYGRFIFTTVDFLLLALSSLTIVSISMYVNMKLKIEMHRREAEMERIKRIALEEKLRSIRMKLSDHFLFNTLNAVSEIVREDPQKAEEVLVSLSNLYRKMLKVPEAWSLKEELNFIEDYMNIISMRFKNSVDYEFEMKDGAENLVVPSLSLQPIVENALFHGLSKVGGGKISIRAFSNGMINEIEIENTGILKSPILPGEGLRIVEERFRAIYRYFEMFHRIESGSTIFTVIFGGKRDEVRGHRG